MSLQGHFQPPAQNGGDRKHFIKHDGIGIGLAGGKVGSVMIWAESPFISNNETRHSFRGKSKMPRSKKDHGPAKKSALANHYRAIGPAAIVAALLHTAKKKAPTQKFISPRAA